MSSRPITLRPLMLVGLWGLAASGCGGEPSTGPETRPPPTPSVNSIDVAPGTATLTSLGESLQFAATLRDAAGNVVTGVAVSWSSSSVAVASVNASGLATAVAGGVAQITASVGGVTGSAQLEVMQLGATLAIEVIQYSLLLIDETSQLDAVARDANGNAVSSATLTWSSSDPSVASVDVSGLVSARRFGSVWIRVSYEQLGDSVRVSVVDCKGELCDLGLIAQLGFDPFYKKIVYADGIPIISSEKPSDEALWVAQEIILNMLALRPDVRDEMIANEARIGIMGHGEVTTDIPEHAFLKDDPNTDWDERARGLGGTVGVPITTGAEENLICLEPDVYAGESILVHEFAHGMHNLGVDFVDSGFDQELETVYQSAMSSGLWKDTYAATNRHEYWAEGVQAWFDANQAPQPGIHNDVDTRAELEAYDPILYELISRYMTAQWFPNVCD